MIDPRMMRTKPLTPEKPQRTAGYKWVPATDEEFAEVLERYSERMAIVVYEPESYILVTRFPRSWRNISRRHGITS